MLIFDNRCMIVRWDESLRSTWLEVKTYSEGEEYRAGLRALLAFAQNKHNTRHLGDARNMGPITQADQRWTHEEFSPALIVAGVRHMALVIPHSAVARLSLRYIVSKTNDVHFTTNHFDTMEAARAWLRSV